MFSLQYHMHTHTNTYATISFSGGGARRLYKLKIIIILFVHSSQFAVRWNIIFKMNKFTRKEKTTVRKTETHFNNWMTIIWKIL